MLVFAICWQRKIMHRLTIFNYDLSIMKMDPLIKEAADSLVLHIKKRINECNEVDFAW